MTCPLQNDICWLYIIIKWAYFWKKVSKKIANTFPPICPDTVYTASWVTKVCKTTFLFLLLSATRRTLTGSCALPPPPLGSSNRRGHHHIHHPRMRTETGRKWHGQGPGKGLGFTCGEGAISHLFPLFFSSTASMRPNTASKNGSGR